MITLDVTIWGPHGAVDLSNGLLGAATTVFMAAGHAVQTAGRAGM